MTEQEITIILNIGPFDKIANLCNDRQILLAILAVMYHKGVQAGMKEAHDDFNQILNSQKFSHVEN